MNDPTRRAVLAAGAAGLAGTAGCGSRLPFGDGDASLDAAALVGVTAEPIPAPPRPFPVEVPDAWVGDHRKRGRELLGRVPEEPTIPNEATAAAIVEARQEVRDRIEEGPEPEDRQRRLGWWRRQRREAARVAGAYRAATGEASREAAVARSERLRAALGSFRQSWEYAAAAPPGAVVVHARLEQLSDRWAGALDRWAPFPADPRAEVFRVGEVAGLLEAAAARKTDASRLRERYQSTRETTPYRYHLAGAVERLEYATERGVPDLHEFTWGQEAEENPFDRDIRGTPAGVAFRELGEHVREASRRAERRERAPAARFLSLGKALATRAALATVVRRIRDGAYGMPADAAAVGDRYDAALAALREAWRTAPRPLAGEVAAPAYDLFRRAHHELANEAGEGTVSEERVADTTGWLIAAERIAAAVPGAVKRATATLPER